MNVAHRVIQLLIFAVAFATIMVFWKADTFEMRLLLSLGTFVLSWLVATVLTRFIKRDGKP